jgi:uncharacterized iron-regulated membrane protein
VQRRSSRVHTFRQLCFNLHRYIGIATLVVAVILGLTGAILAFELEINHWFARGVIHVRPGVRRLPMVTLLQNALRNYPGYRPTSVRPGMQPNRSVGIWLTPERGKDLDLLVYVDPYTGVVLGPCGAGCAFIDTVRELHTTLLLRRPWSFVVGYATLLVLFNALSGVYLWWKRKLWRLNFGVGSWRLNYDIHNVVGLYIAPLMLISTLTGTVIAFPWANDLVLKVGHAEVSEQRSVPLSSTAVPGAKARTLDEQIAAAEAAVPSLKAQRIGMPSQPQDAIPITLAPVSGDDERARTAFLDQYSGRLLLLTEPRSSDRSWLRKIVPLHTGSILGWPTKLLMCLTGLLFAVLSASGVLSWWKRAVIARRQLA